MSERHGDKNMTTQETNNRNRTNETLELMTSYEASGRVLALVAQYLEGNRGVTDANTLGAGLAQCLESEFGSQELAQRMNEAGY